MNKFHFTGSSLINIAGRLILAIVLLLSGLSKLFYLQEFASEVAHYSELYISSFLIPWNSQISIIVCCSEILLGLLLLIPKMLLVSTLGVFVLMTFFLYLTGINYLNPTLLGSIETCGCFGELIHFSAKGSFIKAIILWAIAFIVFASNIKDTQTLLYKWRVIRKA